MSNVTQATKPTVAARRSRDGRYAVCARPLPGGGVCGERLAHIVPQGGSTETVCFLGGFSPDDDGVWTLGRWARRRWNDDRRATARGDQAAARRLREELSTHHRRRDDDTFDADCLLDLNGPVSHVICPACQMTNRLTPDLLDTA